MGGGGDDMGGGDPVDMGVDMQMMDMRFPDAGSFQCAYPSSDPACPQAAFGPGSVINAFELVTDESCCRNMDGEPGDDNYLGSRVLPLLETAFMQDFQANVDAAIANGSLLYMFEYARWSNAMWDMDFDVTLYRGDDADLDVSNNFGGNGSFYVTPDSFDAQGDPNWTFNRAEVRNGAFLATGGSMELDFPGLSDLIVLRIVDVQLEATVESGADLSGGGGVTLRDGELSAALVRDDLYQSINALAAQCSCMSTLTGPMLEYDSTNDNYKCNLTRAEYMACGSSPSETCKSLGSSFVCGTVLRNLSTQVDVDALPLDNPDGTNDSYSFGARFTAVPAEILERP
jgi:hypothetical protein